MKNSLFRKYFMICSMCVLTSIAVLGVVLMLFASQFYESDKYNLLERSVTQAAEVTGSSFTLKTFYIEGEIIQEGQFKISWIFSSLATSIDGEFWLTERDGEVLWREENGSQLAIPYYNGMDRYYVSELAIEQAQGGLYKDKGDFGGIYATPQYIVGVPVSVRGSDLAYLFVASPTETLTSNLVRLLEIFLFSAVAVLIAAFTLIYFITSRMVKPLKEMLAATHSFSRGDFSIRVPVSGYDELGQLSMAFNNMASTLATTETSRRSFVANVSHELKTPMTTIGGFVDGMLDGTIPAEKREQYLQVVSSEVKRLSRLVRSMLDTARIEAGEMKVNPVWFDISELSRQTVFTFEQMITDKGLEIEGLDIDKVMVYADQDLMNQVVYNLVENAVKFVNEGGTISFGYRSDNKMTYVAIRNTGEGLENEEIPKLFDRFYKSDKSRSLNKNGVGLGLHIVRSIINYHQGEVVVRSAPGEFTEFEIGIPNVKKAKDDKFLAG